MGSQMNKNGRDRGRRKTGDIANLTEIMRPCTFEPLDHFVGKTADSIELKGFRYFQCVVVIDTFRRGFLLFDITAVQRISEGRFEIRQLYVLTRNPGQ